MTTHETDTFVVGDWQVDPAAGTLVRDGTNVRLQPKVMEVLVYLSSRPGEIVTRNELEREVWRGMVIGYDAVTTTVTKLRKALDDDTHEPRYIATIPKRGYRLLARVDRDPQLQATAFNKPGIAVLPFKNLSENPEHEYFADGICVDITTGLAKFHWFIVIACNSSFTYRGAGVDAKKVARELGVRYVVTGSVRRAADRMRISAQLIDADTGRHIWAESYDRSIEDMFSVQDEISEAITTTVAPAFIASEAQRADRKAPENLDAWDYTARGNWYLGRRGRDDIKKAIELFEAALEIDPNNTAALSGLAFALCWVNIFDWHRDRNTIRELAYDSARRAVDLDDTDAWAHAILGWVRFSAHDLDAAINECNRALQLNPSLALAESVLSIARSWQGENVEALRHAKAAQRLSPRDPGQSMSDFARACAEFGDGNYAAAVEWAQIATAAMPEFPGAWRYLASGLGHLGKLDEAHAAAQQLLRIMPHDNLQIVAARLPSVHQDRIDRFVGGLRRAGLPEA